MDKMSPIQGHTIKMLTLSSRKHLYTYKTSLYIPPKIQMNGEKRNIFKNSK